MFFYPWGKWVIQKYIKVNLMGVVETSKNHVQSDTKLD